MSRSIRDSWMTLKFTIWTLGTKTEKQLFGFKNSEPPDMQLIIIGRGQQQRLGTTAVGLCFWLLCDDPVQRKSHTSSRAIILKPFAETDLRKGGRDIWECNTVSGQAVPKRLDVCLHNLMHKFKGEGERGF